MFEEKSDQTTVGMADPLSIAASAFSVASLDIHLLDKAKAIYDVWTLLQGASTEFDALSDRLRDVSGLLQKIAGGANDESSNTVILSMLIRCQKQLAELWAAVRGMQSYDRSLKTRMKKPFKIIFTETKMKNMRNAMQILLTDLSLALRMSDSQKINNSLVLSTGSYDRIVEVQ
ncbi:MAG: hypothetical protein M1830_005970 [Pleopsidium flavum]|nr:MAG: hypothetical protein M1830_005970 [Pleopsidium flavum]